MNAGAHLRTKARRPSGLYIRPRARGHLSGAADAALRLGQCLLAGPANNWGTQPGGYDLTNASGVSFWARGEQGAELLTFHAGGMSCSTMPYLETFCPAQSLDPSPVALTSDWKLYTFPFTPGTDFSSVMGPFVWSISKQDNPSGAVFYLDDIQYLFNVSLPPQAHSIYNGPRLADGCIWAWITLRRADWLGDRF